MRDRLPVHEHTSSKQIVCWTSEKMFYVILFVGFLCFSNSAITISEANTTAGMITSNNNNLSWPTPSTIPYTGPPGIIFYRIGAISSVDLSMDSPEIQLLLQQMEALIPAEYKASTNITVRSIQKVPSTTYV